MAASGFNVRRWIVAVTSLAFAVSASAQSLPPEVAEPYKIFAAEYAKDDPDRKVLAEFGYKAWKAAEASLEDAKLTGDLAINFAEQRYAFVDGKLKPQTVIDAYARAVDLSRFYDVEANDIEIQRRLLQAAYHIDSERYAENRADAGPVLRALESRIEELGWQSRVYFAEMQALRSQRALLSGKNKSALRYAREADRVFEDTADKLFSPLRYQNALFLSVALRRQGEKDEAARIAQTIVDGHLKTFGQYTGPSIVAYQQWIEYKKDLEDKKTLTPEQIELMAWTPPDSPVVTEPAYRVPPMMPPNARSSGEVEIMFDIKEDGRLENIRILNSTSRVFNRPTLESVEDWLFPPGMPAEKRKNVTNKVTFVLTRPGGSIIKAR